jgi:hypothetical protein
MQLNTFWILILVFGTLALSGGLGMRQGKKWLNSSNSKFDSIFVYAFGVFTIIGVIGLIITIGLMVGGVLESFEDKEKQSC